MSIWSHVPLLAIDWKTLLRSIFTDYFQDEEVVPLERLEKERNDIESAESLNAQDPSNPTPTQQTSIEIATEIEEQMHNTKLRHYLSQLSLPQEDRDVITRLTNESKAWFSKQLHVMYSGQAHSQTFKTLLNEYKDLNNSNQQQQNLSQWIKSATLWEKQLKHGDELLSLLISGPIAKEKIEAIKASNWLWGGCTLKEMDDSKVIPHTILRARILVARN